MEPPVFDEDLAALLASHGGAHHEHAGHGRLERVGIEDRRAFGRAVQAACDSGVARIGQKAFLIASVMLIAFCAVGVILWI